MTRVKCPINLEASSMICSAGYCSTCNERKAIDEIRQANKAIGCRPGVPGEAWGNINKHGDEPLIEEDSGAPFTLVIPEGESIEGAVCEVFGTNQDPDQMGEFIAACSPRNTTLFLNRYDLLLAAIEKTHSVKGRYHMQNAMCDLYDLVGLKNIRPKPDTGFEAK